MTHRTSSARARLWTLIVVTLLVVPLARAAEKPFASASIDAAFTPGLAKIKQATGFVANEPADSNTDWKGPRAFVRCR